MVTTARKLITENEFFEMPDEVGRFDLIDGVLIRMPGAGGYHGQVSIEIGSALLQVVKPLKLGRLYGPETGFVISKDPDTVLCPDIGFVRASRVGGISRRERFVPFAPDLAVEIVSPGDSRREVLGKVERYLRAGTEQVWVAMPPARSVEVHRRDIEPIVLHQDDMLTAGDLLPGFSMRVGDLFPED